MNNDFLVGILTAVNGALLSSLNEVKALNTQLRLQLEELLKRSLQKPEPQMVPVKAKMLKWEGHTDQSHSYHSEARITLCLEGRVHLEVYSLDYEDFDEPSRRDGYGTIKTEDSAKVSHCNHSSECDCDDYREVLIDSRHAQTVAEFLLTQQKFCDVKEIKYEEGEELTEPYKYKKQLESH